MRSKMNVTPFIDILLVLLIAFILLLHKLYVPLQLADESTGSARESHAIVLELTAGGGYELNRMPVAADDLGRVLREAFELRSDKILFLKAAGSRAYHETIAASDVARGAGVEVIALAP